MFGSKNQDGPSEGSKEWEIGQQAKDGSIFIGQRGLINPDGSLDKVYNIFVRQKDLLVDIGLSDVFTYTAAVQKTAKFNKRKGYGATVDGTDEETRQALADGTYNGRWTIPSQEVLSSLREYVMDGKVKDNFKGNTTRGSLSEVDVASVNGRNQYGGIANGGNYWSSTPFNEHYMLAQNFDRASSDGYVARESLERNALSVRHVRYVEAEPKQLSFDSLNLSYQDREVLQKFYIKVFREGRPEYIQDQINTDMGRSNPEMRDLLRREIINTLIQDGDDAGAIVKLATAKLQPVEKKRMLDGYLSEVVRNNPAPFIEGVSNETLIASLLKGGADPNAFSGEIMTHLAYARINDYPTSSVAQMLYKNGAKFELGLEYLERSNFPDNYKKAMKDIRAECTGEAVTATAGRAKANRQKKNADVHPPKSRSPN